jgi:hypothetical protein
MAGVFGAMDKNFQNKGWGSVLLTHALRCSYQQSKEWCNGYVILIDAKGSAKDFYKKYGIEVIKESEDMLLMGLRTKDIPKHFPKNRE